MVRPVSIPFSLLSALRRIPTAAFGLKENLGGSSPVSKTSDNEDATAPLGYSEVLSVKHSVGPPIPEVGQLPKDCRHVRSFVRTEKAGDILEDNPARAECSGKADELEEESRPLASQSSAASSH